MKIFKYTPLILATLMAVNAQANVRNATTLTNNVFQKEPVYLLNDGTDLEVTPNNHFFGNWSGSPTIFLDNRSSLTFTENTQIGGSSGGKNQFPRIALGIVGQSTLNVKGNLTIKVSDVGNYESLRGGLGYIGKDSHLNVEKDLIINGTQIVPGSNWTKFTPVNPNDPNAKPFNNEELKTFNDNFSTTSPASTGLFVSGGDLTVGGKLVFKENTQTKYRNSIIINNAGILDTKGLSIAGKLTGNDDHQLINVRENGTLVAKGPIDITTTIITSPKGHYPEPLSFKNAKEVQLGDSANPVRIKPNVRINKTNNGGNSRTVPVPLPKTLLVENSPLHIEGSTIEVSGISKFKNSQSEIVTPKGKFDNFLMDSKSVIDALEANLEINRLQNHDSRFTVADLTVNQLQADQSSTTNVGTAIINGDSQNQGTLSVEKSLTINQPLTGNGTIVSSGDNAAVTVNAKVEQNLQGSQNKVLNINVGNDGILKGSINTQNVGKVNLTTQGNGVADIIGNSFLEGAQGNLKVGAKTTLTVNKLTGDLVIKGTEEGAELHLPMDGTQKVTFENAGNQKGTLINPNPTLKISDGVVDQGYVNKNPGKAVSLKDLAANGPIILGLGKTGQQVVPALRTSLVSLNRLADLTAMADRFHAQRDRKIVVWTDLDANHDRFDDNVTVSSTRRNLARLGAQAHFSRGYMGAWIEGQKNTDRLGLLKAEQKERGYGVFAYAGTEVNNLSTIVDIGYRHLTSETSSDRYSAKPSMRAYSASAQVGYKFPLTTSVTLEPQLQVQVSRTSGYQVTGTNENANGDKSVNIHVDPTITIVSRVGTRMTKQWTKANLFGEVNYLHTFDGHQGIELSDYSVENYHVRNTLAGDRIALKVGGSYAFTPAFSVKASLENQWGKHTKDAFGAKLGVEYAF